MHVLSETEGFLLHEREGHVLSEINSCAKFHTEWNEVRKGKVFILSASKGLIAPPLVAPPPKPSNPGSPMPVLSVA
jgi:hypothetical protein